MQTALLQFQPVLGDVASNLATIERLGRGVRADLWVLPELCLSGYELAGKAEAAACAQA